MYLHSLPHPLPTANVPEPQTIVPSKQDAINELKRLGRRPTGREVRDLAKKYNVSRNTAYNYVREVYGKSTDQQTPQTPQSQQPAPAPPMGMQPPVPMQPPAAPGAPPRLVVESHAPSFAFKSEDVPKERLVDFVSGSTPVPGQEGQQQAQAPQIDPADFAGPMVETMVHVVEMYLTPKGETVAPPGAVGKEDKDLLKSAWTPVVVKYMPYVLKYGVEVNAILATAVVFAPRFQYNRYLKEREANQRKEREREERHHRPDMGRDDSSDYTALGRQLGARLMTGGMPTHVEDD